MLQADAQGSRPQPFSKNIGNVDYINIDVVTEVQKDIEPYDMISLVFLLYDVPDTALQRLIIYQRVYKDIGGNNSNLLREWALYAQSRATWKYEFLEAIVICQLFNVVRKLGYNVTDAKNHYNDNNTYAPHYINPMKKKLYKLCEHMESAHLNILKKTLLTYNVDVMDYEHCELVILDLMCKKFITIHQQHIHGSTDMSFKYDVEKLTKIIDNITGLENIANDIRTLEVTSTVEENNPLTSPSTSTQRVGNVMFLEPKVKTEVVSADDTIKEKYTPEDFKDTHEQIDKLIRTMTIENLKSDKKKQSNNVYNIKNPLNVGICYVINQEDFYPSKSSIENENNTHCKPLEKRIGSTKDKEALEKTMIALNFEVITRDNQDHITMIQGIKDVLKFRVHNSHSIFMLCILSHGTRGYVYAADSVKVKIELLESLLESDDVPHLQGIPKILILQACQIDDDNYFPDLIADAPSYYIKKRDILRYSATAPGYEAYRFEQYGSIFIQILCFVLQECADKDHLIDLFTKVNFTVHKICTELQTNQLPKIDSTLLKKLYIKKPLLI